MFVTADTETVGLVEQFVQRAGQLYSLPAAAAEVLRLANQPQIDPRAVKDCLERDPALTARILRVVNSSLFGPSRPVTDLNQALTLLGIRPLKMLVLGFSLPKELFAGLEADVLRWYWRLALVKAVAARELAEQLWHVPGDEPFLAGLIQDIGLLALVQQLGEPYVNLLDHVQAQGGPLAAAELDTLGFDHRVLSARLLMHWGLPPALAAAISVPANEDRIQELDSDERPLPRILHLAELLVQLIERPHGSALSELLAIGGRYCGMTLERLQPIVATLQRKVEELSKVLSLELPPGQSYLDLLLQAQRQLADESIAVAAELAAPRPEDELLALAGRLQQELAVASRRPSPLRSFTGAATSNLPTGAGLLDDRRDSPVARANPAKPSSGEFSPEPAIYSSVAAAVQRSRQARHAVSLALFEIDHFGDRLLQLGSAEMVDVIHSLRLALAQWCGQSSPAVLASDSRLAVLCEDCPRSDAVRYARQALAAIPAWSRSEFCVKTALTLSCGIATLEVVPLNFNPQQLIDASERCLAGAELSGGNTVKSIEF